MTACGVTSDFGDVCVEAAGHEGGHVSAPDELGMSTAWGCPVLANPVESPCSHEGCNVTSFHEADDACAGLVHNDDGSHTLVSA